MKKFLFAAAVIVVLLFIVDKTILKEKGVVEQAGQMQKYDKMEDPEDLPVGLEKGNLAPDFELTDMEGNPVKLSDYRGKAVLLNFWASWCPPCRAEMPHMEKLYNKYKDENFDILAVNLTNTEKNSGDAEKFVKELGLTFTIPMDVKGEAGSDYNIMAYPTSYFIDSDGVIREKVLGALNEEYMEKEIKKLP
ncbi:MULTISPECIES: TlpA disulfide reductase family protein [Cytobacillus]|jgi:DsbE subfamily thiol:disulfide oxidoreductase|uniref:Thiol:disulfide interchange protein n=2 Tax=Cytobacillus TaxID=2675230 RepID=A0ABX3CSM7_9BACI|nr:MULTISPECIES: TlpA disulfide reductase family protein [Cytobacillus]MBY0154841.1 TlpA family protein disulfide reductase [Cytobacillus firmus]MCM3243397.1 TlpA family protein disulfide reductase [Cytobacillus oceanisediminis]MCM3395913.1 TlpA family protein disulfide reductase [Cytobacillus oceanisediminis]MCM3401661.1 TlpA family protein disulfide reductase [Cytobacillus oceanisediminis]MCM3532115.1 TlpA family protein disulfide reductase [Cytobacillus oceanisediminis]